MNKSTVMTLRVPRQVREGLVRLATRFGHRPAQMGARLLDEGIRRRNFPQIDLRDTAAGRVAYLSGTRFTVCWVAQSIADGLSVERFARDFEVSPSLVRAALAYAESFPEEIAAEAEHAATNRRWIEAQDTADRASRPLRASSRPTKAKPKARG